MFLNKIKERIKKIQLPPQEASKVQEKNYHLYITKNNINGEKVEKIVASYSYDEVSNFMYVSDKDFNTRQVGGWIFYEGNYVLINEVKLSTNGHTYYIGEIISLGAYEKIDSMPEGQIKTALKTVNSLDSMPSDEASRNIDSAWDGQSQPLQQGMPKPSGISQSTWEKILSDVKGMD